MAMSSTKNIVLEKARMGEIGFDSKKIISEVKKHVMADGGLQFAWDFLKAVRTSIREKTSEENDFARIAILVDLCCRKVISHSNWTSRKWIHIFHCHIHDVTAYLLEQGEPSCANIISMHLEYVNYTNDECHSSEEVALCIATYKLLVSAFSAACNNSLLLDAANTCKLVVRFCKYGNCDASLAVEAVDKAFHTLGAPNFPAIVALYGHALQLVTLLPSEADQDAKLRFILQWTQCLVRACPLNEPRLLHSCCFEVVRATQMSLTGDIQNHLELHLTFLERAVQFLMKRDIDSLNQLALAATAVGEKELRFAYAAPFELLAGVLQDFKGDKTVREELPHVAIILVVILARPKFKPRCRSYPDLLCDMDFRTSHLQWIVKILVRGHECLPYHAWADIATVLIQFGRRVSQVLEAVPVGATHMGVLARIVGSYFMVCKLLCEKKVEGTLEMLELTSTFSVNSILYRTSNDSDHDSDDEESVHHIVGYYADRLAQNGQHELALKWLALAMALDSPSAKDYLLQKWADVKSHAIQLGMHDLEEMTLKRILAGSREILGVPVPPHQYNSWECFDMEMNCLSGKENCRQACWEVMLEAMNIAQTASQKELALLLASHYQSKYGGTSGSFHLKRCSHTSPSRSLDRSVEGNQSLTQDEGSSPRKPKHAKTRKSCPYS